jgi:peptidoglycan/LPS O-acetylase OafA/YrhL
VTIAPPRTTPSGDTAAATSSGGELCGLTGLRIVAAVWVVAFHFHFTALTGVTEVVGVLGPLITSGALGVDLFFVLSGFVIAYTYLEQLGRAPRAGATARFVWARISRTWPVYALVLHLFGLVLVVRLVFGSDDQIAFQAVQPVVSGGEWLQQLFLVQTWDEQFFDGASWVGPTWSISAEWLAYLLFPVAALAFYRMRNLPLWVLGTAALALMTPMVGAYLSLGHPYYAWSWLVRILCGFGAGVFAYLVVRRLRADSEPVRRAASVTAAVVPVLIVAGLWLGELAGPGRGGAVAVLFPVLVGALALADRGPARVLSHPWAVYGGRISYALYLVHIPMFELFWLAQAYLPELAAHTALGHVVGTGVVLGAGVVAAATYRWVEEPARRHMRHLVAPRVAGPSEPKPLPAPLRAAIAAPRTPHPADERAGLARPRCLHAGS